MNYQLQDNQKKVNFLKTIKSFNKFLEGESKTIFLALFFVLINAVTAILGPKIQGDSLDNLLINKDLFSLLNFIGLLIAVYIIGGIASYLQIMITGRLGQRVLFKLRDSLFKKLQSLPVAFFNQNKAGDLISRINSDADKVNSFLSENLLRLIGNVFILLGIAVFMLFLNFNLALVTLSVTLALFVLTQLISPLLKKLNRVSLDSTGNLSAQIQESLNAFKIIIAFNRRDYFENKFKDFNKRNYIASLRADIFNQLLKPIYDLASNIAQLVVVLYGFSLINNGDLTFGVLFTFFTYTQRFYEPLRILANIWGSVQLSLASWARLQQIFDLKSNLIVLKTNSNNNLISNNIIEFSNVDFSYSNQNQDYVLKNVSFKLQKGKTYALVGPTGGGKSTTASLMARLYDSTNGEILFNGLNIKNYTPEDLANNISFILQDPLLFTGSVFENIKYGNDQIKDYSVDQIHDLLMEKDLSSLVDNFPNGLNTQINNNAENISLGQKQIISFVRAILRSPKLLILDEATANIDTVTEQLLQSILNRVPKETTKVIIAHRLNTIKNADQIFFVAEGNVSLLENNDSIEDHLRSNIKKSQSGIIIC